MEFQNEICKNSPLFIMKFDLPVPYWPIVLRVPPSFHLVGSFRPEHFGTFQRIGQFHQMNSLFGVARREEGDLLFGFQRRLGMVG
jgi:hypothetical protein